MGSINKTEMSAPAAAEPPRGDIPPSAAAPASAALTAARVDASTAGPAGAPPPPDRGVRIVDRLRDARSVEELGILAALIAMVAVVTAFHSNFLSVVSIGDLLQQASSYGIIALGMVFLLSMGEIDLSVGGNMGVCAVCCALLVKGGLDPWISMLLAFGVGIVLGMFNAVVANLFRLPLIIVTLGTLSMYQGLELVISNGQTATGGNTSGTFFTWLGGDIAQIPVAAFVFAGLTIAMTIVYRKSAFAFAVRAIGSNPSAARLSGYPIGRIRLYVAGMVGLLCAVSGVLSYAFFASADPSLGNGLELQVIAAAIIGGTALSGGRGTILGALLGALIISVISGALTQFGVSINWADFVTGAVIIAAVSLDAVVKRRQRVEV
jgi:ribose transport system permease protein